MAGPIDVLRREIENGASVADAICRMQQMEMPILEAIKAVRELFGMQLGEAKRLVSEHPAYQEIAKASVPLHEEIVRALNDERSMN